MIDASIRFVVVAYNPRIEILNALLRELSSYQCLVVWNSRKNLSRTQSGVRHIQNKKNVGFGEGANRGIAYVLTQGAEWVILINQDVCITKHALRQFIHDLKSGQGDIVGPFAGYIDARRWTTYLGLSQLGKPDYVSGSFMAIRAHVFSNIGFFHTSYYMYYEDVDFCARARRAGLLLKAIHIAGINHTDTMTLGKGSFLHTYYLARNHLLFVERQAPWEVKMYEVVRLPKTLWKHYKKKEFGGLVGIRDYYIRRFGAYKKYL